jgi:hypothetical protein
LVALAFQVPKHPKMDRLLGQVPIGLRNDGEESRVAALLN